MLPKINKTTVVSAKPLIKLNGRIPRTMVVYNAFPVCSGMFRKYVYIGKKTK